MFVFPELLLIVLATMILMGRYTGYRLLELWRFRYLLIGKKQMRFVIAWRALKSKGVLGINQRNADYILPLNKRRYYPLVDDKLATKNYL